MNKQTALWCAAFIYLTQTNTTLAEEASGSSSPECSHNTVETSADSARVKRPTNSEEANRRYRNEEIRNAAPPPVRVRAQPTPTPRLATEALRLIMALTWKLIAPCGSHLLRIQVSH